MYPFEVWDETTQQIEFYYNRFAEFEDNLFRQYPTTPNHLRVEVDLYFPSDRLEDVYVHDWNPHHEIGNRHLSVYDCFYDSSNWSTIFETYPLHDRSNPHAIKLYAEEDHTNPWGEPIRFMSTSWDFRNNSSHRFAYFRGKYWKVLSPIFYNPRMGTNYLYGHYNFDTLDWITINPTLYFPPADGVIWLTTNHPPWARWYQDEMDWDWKKEGF